MPDDTRGLTDEQLAMRRTGLTATDMVILAGASPFGNELEVYEEKIGAPPPRDTTIAMQMGHAAEPVIVRALCAKYDLKVRAGATIRHSILPWVLATPDRFVITDKGADDGVMEAKLVGWRMVDAWRSPTDPEKFVFPTSVAVQAMWQMGTTGQRRCFVGAFLGGWADEDFHHTIMEWNERLWLALLELAESFWKDHVLAKVPPTPDGSERAREVLTRLYPQPEELELDEAPSHVEELMVRYKEASSEESAAAKVKSELGNELRALIGSKLGFIGQDLKVVWDEQKGRVDMDLVQRAHSITDEDLDLCRGPKIRALNVRPLSKADKKGR